MTVKTFSLVTFTFAAAMGSATAAPLPFDSTQSATIYSRDAYSRFDRNGYTPGLDISDEGGQAASKAPIVQDTKTFVPPSETPVLPAFLPVNRTVTTPNTSGSAQDEPTEGPAVRNAVAFSGDRSSDDLGFAAGSGGADLAPAPGGSPSTTVGTVPLPPALPMFGAAILALAALGMTRRRGALRKL